MSARCDDGALQVVLWNCYPEPVGPNAVRKVLNVGREKFERGVQDALRSGVLKEVAGRLVTTNPPPVGWVRDQALAARLFALSLRSDPRARSRSSSRGS